MKQTQSKYLWLSIPIISAFVTIFQVLPVLPAIMQDEYVYSMEARYTPFSQQIFPDYLFYWLFNSTSVCGDAFYQCAKSYNAVFLFTTLTFIFLIARMYLSFGWAIAITSLAALSSIGSYVSFFMPESMYFSFITASIWLALKSAQSQKTLSWLMLGFLLGLAALVKPHAIFSLPAIMLFAFLVSIRGIQGNLKKALVTNIVLIGGFFATKLGLGFAFAGVAGLSLFGTGYTGSLPGVNTSLGDAEVFVAQTVSYGPNLVSPFIETAPQVTSSSFLDVFLPHLPIHLAVIMIFGSFPILLSFSVLKDALQKKKEISPASQFQLLIGALAFSLPIVMALFEAFVTVSGDDHSRRIITRHYEFLFPLLLVSAVNFLKFVEPKTIPRFIQGGVVVISSFVVMLWIGPNLEKDFADSIMLYGFNDSGWLTPVIAIVGLAAGVFWIADKERAAKAVAFALIPLTLFLGGLAGKMSLINRVGTEPAYFDIAGQVAKVDLAGVPSSEIIVIGNANYLNTTTKFWLDKPNVRDVVVADGATADLAKFEDVEYVILIGNASITVDNTVLSQGDGYAVLQLNH